MIVANESDCEHLTKPLRTAPYQVIWAIMALISILGLWITVPIVRLIKLKVIPEGTASLLLSLLVAFSFVFQVMIIITSMFHLFVFLTSTSTCDVAFYAKDCLWSFPVITFCLIGTVTTLAGLAVTRIFCTIDVSAKWENSCWMRMGLVFVVIVVSTFSLILGMIEIDFNEHRINCLLIPTSTANTANYLYFFLLFLDGTCFFLYVLAWKQTDKLDKTNRYDVSVKLKVKNNLRGLRLCFPLVTVHFIVFGIYTTGTIILRFHRKLIPLELYNEIGFGLFIIPFYIFAQNLLILRICRSEYKERLKIETQIFAKKSGLTDEFFKNLVNQWDRPKSVGHK